MTFELHRERRVRRRGDYLRVQSTARRLSSRHFHYLVAQQRGAPPSVAEPASPVAPVERARSRLGVVVTRKIGNAVARNRVKRLCRECFRQWPEWLPDGIDFVVVARPGAPELTLEQVRTEWRGVERALRKRSEDVARAGAGGHVLAPARPGPKSSR